MAFAAANLSAEPRSFSIGPWKVQIMEWTCASGDTSGTITADALSTVIACHVTGLGKGMSAKPTYSGNVVTLAFADPVATCGGTAILIGR